MNTAEIHPFTQKPSTDLFAGIKQALHTASGTVTVLPGSDVDAWAWALSKTLSPGDTVVVVGAQSANRFAAMDLNIEVIDANTTSTALAKLSQRLGRDRFDEIKAVFVTYDEGSATKDCNVAAVRCVLDENFHDAFLMVDGVVALESGDFHMDAWEVDVVVPKQSDALASPGELAILAMSLKARPALRFAAE